MNITVIMGRAVVPVASSLRRTLVLHRINQHFRVYQSMFYKTVKKQNTDDPLFLQVFLFVNRMAKMFLM